MLNHLRFFFQLPSTHNPVTGLHVLHKNERYQKSTAPDILVSMAAYPKEDDILFYLTYLIEYHTFI